MARPVCISTSLAPRHSGRALAMSVMPQSSSRQLVAFLLLVLACAALCFALLMHRARQVSDLHRITANAQLLCKALRDHQRQAGVWPPTLEALASDGGDTPSDYLRALTNQFVVIYTLPSSNTADTMPGLSLTGSRYSVTVTKDFQVHVTK